ncbi:MAG: excinuclease ABC subunit UvrA [Alphaproteobacteria bacterium]|nr:excinuclease ABC subunit UvrA [Alphaproteobacteria bacterium]
MTDPSHIVVRSARTHNLRGIDLDIPRNQLVVFTGVSGSGKSSLVFDTVFKEGQRRFTESLSAYARQFLGQLERPDVDAVEGVSPTLSIDQKTVNRNPRSTVGTITEIFDHLRLLLARLGTPHCPLCDTPISRLGVDQVVDTVIAWGGGRRVQVLAPVIKARKGEYRKEMADLARDGWLRARVDGTMCRLDDPPELDRYVKHTLEVVVDRLVPSPSDHARLSEAVEQALAMGEQTVTVLVDDEERTFSTARACPNHPDQSVPELEPRLFSFNSPEGACPTCNGLGVLQAFEPRLMLDEDQPLATAFKVFNDDGKVPFGRLNRAALLEVGAQLGVEADAPVGTWPKAARQQLLWGDPDVTWEHTGRDGRVRTYPWLGLVPSMERVWHFTKFPGFDKYRSSTVCPDCQGSRLNPIARAVRFRDAGIHELAGMTVGQAHAFFADVSLDGDEREIGALLVQEIGDRLAFLAEVGLGYLSLSRSAATLSGGESQRIRLASQVGSGLQGVTYVLDEPSIGLHPRDNQRLIQAIARLRDRGNSVLVVEHDEETILAADWVVEIGPGAGREGGFVTAEGTPGAFVGSDCLTARYLRREEVIPMPATRRAGSGDHLVVRGAFENNLRDVDVRFPLGTLTVITGVSGSGKSSLTFQVLEASLTGMVAGTGGPVGCRGLDGVGHVDKVVRINQRPIGRTPRSNPATYTGAMDLLRDLFAQTEEARARGYTKSRFSFNVKGGRCEDCEGAGVKTIEMQFLPDVEVPCETCGGRRFNRETLDVTWHGLDIAQVLDLTLGEALERFGAVPKLARILQTLVDVGLEYVALGQPSTTLSGGEAQRVKLASELHRPATGSTVYLLDEPTTGLHVHDVRKLLHALQRLVDAGNTVLVVEHHTDVIKCADHVLDLGPEGGDGGGTLVGAGTPEDIAAMDTPTGRALAGLPEFRGTAPVVAEAAPPPLQVRTSTPRAIRVEGARKHNLQDIDVQIPHHTLTVITGPSGSGKTSLAFDTIFAEGQRRYVESLSTYARRFLGRLDRAPLDRIEGLQPAIAIDQGSAGHNPRSTVATVTEIHDVLRLLYARVGTPHCPHCATVLRADPPSGVARRLAEADPGAGWLTTVLPPDPRPDERRGLLLRDGWQRLLGPDGAEIALDDPAAEAELAVGATLVVDRVDPSRSRPRVAEAVVSAYHLGHGHVAFRPRAGGEPLRFTEQLVCPTHGSILPELTPRHFSFNSRLGMCPECEGLGAVKRHEKSAEGVWTEREVSCPDCGGGRLRPEVLAVTLEGMAIDAFARLTVADARAVVDGWDLGGERAVIAARARLELAQRLGFLVDVGLGYVSLDRQADTLSGGESQRIRLASQLGSQLTGVTYVLDEPTIGLHPRDTERLLGTLEGLRDLGNTVLVVEHDTDTILRADHVIDMGPEAGRHGGRVVAEGPPAALLADPRSVTGRWLSGAEHIPPRSTRKKRKAAGRLRLTGARTHNLQGVDLDLPLGQWTAVTGVSGSGKSSLIMDTLAPALQRQLGQDVVGGVLDALVVDRPVDGLVLVDQNPIGRSPRSTPATYVGVMDKLRALFAQTTGAQERGWKPGRFSFNSPGGRCEHCEGRGAVLIEMHFLPDVWVTCHHCKGRRFSRETLSVRWAGHTIADVLNLRADEAVAVFSAHKAIARGLQALVDVGLGYVTIGQPSTTLSGGEAQRVKLASELTARKGHRIYVLDEPTTGLHLSDVAKLVGVLHRLVDKGHTVITIEHHLDMIGQADHVVELGPEGGAGGGRLVASGTPEALAARDTPTGVALAAWRRAAS